MRYLATANGNSFGPLFWAETQTEGAKTYQVGLLFTFRQFSAGFTVMIGVS